MVRPNVRPQVFRIAAKSTRGEITCSRGATAWHHRFGRGACVHPTATPAETLPRTTWTALLASMSPADTAAALRLLKVLEECRQMSPIEAEAWRRRIEGWATVQCGGGEGGAEHLGSPRPSTIRARTRATRGAPTSQGRELSRVDLQHRFVASPADSSKVSLPYPGLA